MRRLSAQAFEATAGAHTWAPVEKTSPADVTNEASSQTETYRQAYLEGFEAGFADGDKEAHRALHEAQEAACVAQKTAQMEEERWRAALASLSNRFKQSEQNLQTEMEALAVTIAYASVCRLVGRMHAEHDLVAALCREAFESMHLEPTRLRVAQADRISIEEGCPGLSIVAEPGLEPGDCVIETPLGDIEAGIEVQLHALLQALLGTMGRNGGNAHDRR